MCSSLPIKDMIESLKSQARFFVECHQGLAPMYFVNVDGKIKMIPAEPESKENLKKYAENGKLIEYAYFTEDYINDNEAASIYYSNPELEEKWTARVNREPFPTLGQWELTSNVRDGLFGGDHACLLSNVDRI